ncbi:MAG: carboxypeptidase regulatory-like domain-containing protein [Alphaproteobacteria bacterium]|nr:carboxypeptidase regulatory-like domain-containing protein [Alphaproteobacteria bacterium]
MMKRFGLILAVALGAPGCNAEVGQAGPGGTIAGHVTLGPIMPVCRVDVPCDGAYKDARVVVRTKSGAVVARATSDANGDFRLDVAAGAYTVGVAVEGMMPRCGEAEAVVAQGQTVRVAIDCDSGIR